MVFPSLHIVYNEQETEKLARDFSSILNPGQVIILNGNLGTGKTFFIKSNFINKNLFLLVTIMYKNASIYCFNEQIFEVHKVEKSKS